MKILFATAELSPIARVGGLAEAAAGLTSALSRAGHDVEVVLPDYDGRRLDAESSEHLDVPDWAAPAHARRGHDASGRAITLVDVPGIARPHPYLDLATGEGYADNDVRFFAFSAAVAALARSRQPDIVHLNDWHTSLALGLGLTTDAGRRLPTVLTIHTIGYQGHAAAHWLERVSARDAFEWYGGINPLAGAITLADRVIAVSPSYASEIVTPEFGVGLDERLAARGDHLVGIRNGIDTDVWDPAADGHIAVPYTAAKPEGKAACREALCRELGWPDADGVIIGMVTRLADQKGVDLALDAARFLPELPGRLVLLGAGSRQLADDAHALAAESGGRVYFREGYDDAFGHRIFAGADLFLMPSRFEPCGLAQMQAMAYGTIPVTTAVGGLRDTVLDDDRARGEGNGFVSRSVDAAGIADALHRAARATRHAARRRAIQRRGMSVDWSWRDPAADHIALYRELLDAT